jgi:hypothetical protein
MIEAPMTTSKQLLLTALIALRETLPDENDPRRVFVDDVIWSVREAIHFEQCSISVAEWWEHLGPRDGDSPAFH